MSDDDIQTLRLDMKQGFDALGKRLNFLERTVYTGAGICATIAFLVSTGHLKLGS